MDTIIVVIVGILLIIGTYWFFLMKRDHVIVAHDSVDIVVDGGYSPEVVSIQNNKTTILNFIRRDPSSCLEEVVLGDFKIRRHLPLNQRVAITLTPRRTGVFPYACGMNMYHGKIIVTE